MLQLVHIAHNRFREIRQVPLPEVAKGQFSQTLGQSDADCFDLAIDQAVRGSILLQMRYKR